jgi:hypothetical protein
MNRDSVDGGTQRAGLGWARPCIPSKRGAGVLNKAAKTGAAGAAAAC